MTQPTIWHVQAAHLAILNWQMAQAQHQQAWQAIWLRQTWSAHPLIFEVAVPDAPAPSGPVNSSTYVERSVVERQVVVVRCKYCGKYAPVDKPTCEHCGAAGYGSST